MSKRRSYTTILLIVMTCFTSGVNASEGQWYLGVGGGATSLKPETEGSPFRLDESSSTGIKVFLGYDWNRKFGVEAYYADLGEATFTNEAELTYAVFGLGINYYFPDNESGPSFFLKAGVSSFNNSGNINFTVANSAQIYLGAGAEVQFENGFAIRGEFDYYDTDAQYFGLALSKRFGRGPDDSGIPDWARDIQVGGPEFDSEESGYTTLNPEDILPGDAQVLPPASVESFPDIQNPSVLTSSLGVIEGVEFISGTSALKPQSLPILDRVARTMAQYGTTQFVIIGHTDDVGDPASNRTLSLEQVKQIGEYLESKGVNAKNLSYIGAGEDEPRTRNDSPEGRAMNRRIEILLY